VAEDGSWPARQHCRGGFLKRLFRWTTHGVDAEMDAEEAAFPDGVVDRVAGQAEVQQLPTSDVPVLSERDLGDLVDHI
jgi:hypothetical protein